MEERTTMESSNIHCLIQSFQCIGLTCWPSHYNWLTDLGPNLSEYRTSPSSPRFIEISPVLLPNVLGLTLACLTPQTDLSWPQRVDPPRKPSSHLRMVTCQHLSQNMKQPLADMLYIFLEFYKWLGENVSNRQVNSSECVLNTCIAKPEPFF